MDITYAEVGTEVVICFHRLPRNPMCQIYRGRRTTITETDGSSLCRVAADNGQCWWSIDNMILASEIDLLTPDQRERIK